MDDARALARRLSSAVGDRRVLEAIAATPRELFVGPDRRAQAYDDEALPIGGGQTISQPTVVARMLELLELTGDERVLDVGTGSGWHAALLGRLAAEVVTIERDPELVATARANLRAAGATRVHATTGDGWAPGAGLAADDRSSFDAINVAACPGPDAPAPLLALLADGGRMVIPLRADDGEDQFLVRLRRDGDRLIRETLARVRFVPLVR